MAWSSTGPWKAKDSVTSPSSPLRSTVASRLPSRQTLPSLPNRMLSPSKSFLAGFTSACQREPSIRLISVASILGSVARPMRRPASCAGITLVSLTTIWSPAASQSGRSEMTWSRSPPSGCTTSRRAESRGLAGRSAMRSGGRSKSKRSVRMGRCALTHSLSFRGTRSVNPESRDSGSGASHRPGMTVQKLRRVGGHPRLDDLVGILDRLTALDLVDVLHALGHLAPDSVLAVEEGGIVEADEELAVGGVRVGRARHRGGAAHMRLLVELGLQLLAASAGAGAMRAAGLRHEAVDHAMEHDAVVEAFAHQFLDAGDMVGREIRTHLDGHGALCGFKDQSIFGNSHARFSVGWGLGLEVWNRIQNGWPAAAPAMLSVNGIGVQRCNASITATRYSSRSASDASGDSKVIRGRPRISPARLKLTRTAMSIGLARDNGGGRQQV